MVSIHLNPKKAAYQDLLVALAKIGIHASAVVHENRLKLNCDLATKNLFTFNTKGKQSDGLLDTNDIFYVTGMGFTIQKHTTYKDSAGFQKRVQLLPPATFPDKSVFLGKKTIKIADTDLSIEEWQSLYQLYLGKLHIKNDGKEILDHFDMQELMYVSSKVNDFPDYDNENKKLPVWEFAEPFIISGSSNAEVKLELKADIGLDLLAGGISATGTTAPNLNTAQIYFTGFYITNAAAAYDANKTKLNA
jgi:hypothetical protein